MNKRETENGPLTESERIRLQVDVWKQVVQVQQHFNDLEMKIRSYGLTLMLGVLSAAAVAIREEARIEVFGLETSLASLIVLAGVIAWVGFYFMDVGWYHRLLKGAVDQGLALEKELAAHVPGIELATMIGKASPLKLGCWTLHSQHKAHVFYWLGILVLVVFLIGSHVANGA